MKKIDDSVMTVGTANIFADLGFAPAEARNLRMRSELMMALRKYVEREGLTQADAALRLQVTQPRISDLMRGKINQFSLDTLVAMSTMAGMEVDLRIRMKPRRVA
jgi:predicted XRE-type DNA-binding protein